MMTSSDSKSPVFYGYIVVLAALCIMIAVWGSYYAFGIFFKPMLTEFGWSKAILSGAFSISMVIQTVLAIVMGGITDRIGSRIVTVLCGTVLAIGYFLMSRVHSIWQLYVIYGVVVGVGMSGSFVPLTSTAARWFIKRRGIMTGIITSGTGIGALIASPVATRLVAQYDWRLSFIIMGIAVLIIVISAAFFLKRDPNQIGQRAYGESKGSEGLGRNSRGLSVKEAFHTKQFHILAAIFFCFGFDMFTIVVHIVPHTSEMGFSATTAAGVLAMIGGLVVLGRIMLGFAADRFGNRPIFIFGFILASAALFCLIAAKEIWMFYLFAIFFGFSNGGMGTSESPLVAEFFGLKSHGLILAFTGSGFTMGAAFGPFVAGYLFDIGGSYQLAFILCTGISILGLILTLLLKPVRVETRRPIQPD